MKKRNVWLMVAGGVFLVCLLTFVFNRLFNQSGLKSESKKEVMTIKMKLESPAFEHNQMIPVDYTCDGENTSPPLQISQVPQTAKSLVLIVDDPDAPAGDWVHWLVVNISPETRKIEAGLVPEGAGQGVNDFGKNDYGGPCPPSGTHRYQFKLYALDTVLTIPENAKKKEIEAAMQGHIIDQSLLIGLYKK